MRIAIFGGTFDPPHIGHINAAKKAKRDLCLDKLIIMPAFVSPFKTDKQSLTPPLVRLKMCVEAFGAFADISDFEIMRENVSYTIDTVYKIKKCYPSADLFLIVGSDVPEYFDKWKESGKLREYIKLYVIPREIVPVSSTEIREKIRNGEDVSELITPGVAELLRKHNIDYA